MRDRCEPHGVDAIRVGEPVESNTRRATRLRAASCGHVGRGEKRKAAAGIAPSGSLGLVFVAPQDVRKCEPLSVRKAWWQPSETRTLCSRVNSTVMAPIHPNLFRLIAMQRWIAERPTLERCGLALAVGWGLDAHGAVLGSNSWAWVRTSGTLGVQVGVEPSSPR